MSLQLLSEQLLWPSQWKRERKLRSSGQGCLPEPPWFFDEENVRRIETFEFYATQEPSKEPLSISVLSANPVTCGHYVICELVNAFRPVVYVWGDTPVEAPEHDLTGGIRPVLYHILRQEYLHAAGVGVCRNMQCLEVFDIERAGQEFCSELCSRRQRQREYWQERGKKVRQRRIRHQKRAVDRAGRRSVKLAFELASILHLGLTAKTWLPCCGSTACCHGFARANVASDRLSGTPAPGVPQLSTRLACPLPR